MVKKKLKTSPYDPARLLDSEETIGYYIEEVLKENDPGEIAHALGLRLTIAKA